LVETGELIGWVETEGVALGDAAERAEPDAEIRHCEGWAVRDLLAHVGEIHRWATSIVGTPRDNPAVPPPAIPDDGELIAWYRSGHQALVETLRAAPADLDCWYFLEAPSAIAFWARRQALETAMHRVDAEGATGVVTPIDRDLAVDGMAELLLGFGARKKAFEPGSVRLAPTDADPWLVTLTPNGLTATQDDPGTPVDVTVAGTASEVYRWMWNRPSGVEIDGNQAIAAEWQKIAIRWS
jgi:uncharacterized protein (TIGR03083 family)